GGHNLSFLPGLCSCLNTPWSTWAGCRRTARPKSSFRTTAPTKRKYWDFSAWQQLTLEYRFSFNAWMERDNPDHLLHNLPRFLQAWLFFGLMAWVMKVPIRTEDFLRADQHGDPVITTENLRKYQRRWM